MAGITYHAYRVIFAALSARDLSVNFIRGRSPPPYRALSKNELLTYRPSSPRRKALPERGWLLPYKLLRLARFSRHRLLALLVRAARRPDKMVKRMRRRYIARVRFHSQNAPFKPYDRTEKVGLSGVDLEGNIVKLLFNE